MVTLFPVQKKYTAQKGDDFYKDCTDALLRVVDFEDNSGLRASMYEKQINNDLANNILHEEDMETIMNPWKLQGYDFPLEVRNYPILKGKIDLLVGEEIKRRFDYKVMVRNPEAVSEKQRMVMDRYFEIFTKNLKAQTIDEAKFKEELRELDKWKMFEAQDAREKVATDVLAYQYDFLGVKAKCNMGYENSLIMGEEIYGIDFVAKELDLQRYNPLGFYTIRSSSTPYIEDGSAFVVMSYKPLSELIDKYFDDLIPDQIDTLEKAQSLNSNARHSMFNGLTVPSNYAALEFDADIQVLPDSSFTNAFGGGFDESGNIRECRVVWASWRPVLKITYFDEYGIQQEKIVDENYPINKEAGETAKTLWVKEWLQTVKLGEDIYIKKQPFPRIGTSINNPSKCLSPFVGTAYTIGDNKAMSLFSYARPYQYIFNNTMHRTERFVVNSHGSVAPLPLHLIPDGWDMDKWLYYFSYMNLYAYDMFKEGNKGIATGKVAGNMQQLSMGNMNFNNSEAVQQNILFLNLIKSQIDEITGVSAQRQGQIQNRETVGGVERSVVQSSLITEKLFNLHEGTKLRLLTLILEASKFAWRYEKVKRQIILGDMSSIILDFDGEEFAAAEYGLFISDSSSDMELFKYLKDLAGPALQAKMIKFSDIMAIGMTNSPSSIKRRIEFGEKQAEELASQQFKMQQDQLKAQFDKEQVSEDIINELKKYIADLQEETKRMKIQADLQLKSASAEPLDEDLKIRQQEFKEQQHHDNMTQQEKDRELQKQVKDKELAIKEKVASKKVSPN